MGAGKYKGEAMKENQRFTSVWLKRQGRWQAIAEHFTTISPPAEIRTHPSDYISSVMIRRP